MSKFSWPLGISGLIGFHPGQLRSTLRGLGWYRRDYRELKRQAASSKFHFPFARLFPCLTEKHDQSGAAQGHYFFQDLLVARRIHELAPRRHVDVGSRIDGFVAHVASFREIEVFDIRPMTSQIPGVTFRQADLMLLDPAWRHCTDSLSCLHTIEHFGLGRYGDPVDFDGFDKGLRNLHEILEPGGTFHFSTPMGEQRIEFNAHRIFSPRFLVEYFQPDFHIRRFGYLDDSGAWHPEVPLDHPGFATDFGCRYGCAILEMERKR